MQNFNDLMAQVAIAQAVYKTVAEYVSTKSDDNLRAEFDCAIAELYDSTGAKSFDMKIGNATVGTVSVRKSKEHEECSLSVTDQAAFEKWLLKTGLGHTEIVYSEDDVIRYFTNTGEMPEGANIDLMRIPEQITGTTLRVDTNKVADALAGELPQAVSNLLTGGNNG